MSNKDPKIEAVEAVYTAIKSLDSQARSEVISSVFALLGMGATTPVSQTPAGQVQPVLSPTPEAPTPTPRARPKGLTEAINERQPGTNAQRIALFAYWREKHEGIPRFAREDLESYFGKAHLSPPRNYDRDFTKAVDRGWIHEDGAESYITSKGIEVVEANFEGERSYEGRTRKPMKKKQKKPVQKKSSRSRRKAK